jgi:hypothetical protein
MSSYSLVNWIIAEIGRVALDRTKVKANAAMARKLLGIIYQMLKKRQVYHAH